MNLDDAVPEGIRFSDRNISDEGRMVEATEHIKEMERKQKRQVKGKTKT